MTKFLLIPFIIFFSLQTFADAEDEHQVQAQADNEEKQPNSHDNRMNKKWGFVGQVGNYTIVNRNTVGGGAGVMYYLNADHVLSVEMGIGTNYDWLSSVGGDTVNSQDSRLGVYDKIFFGNSFYLKGGLEASHVHYKVNHYPLWASNSVQTADVDLFSVFLGLGNHWQKEHFTIGCDWVGAVIPFANANYTEKDEGGTPYWNLQERLLQPGIIAARVYIGASF